MVRDVLTVKPETDVEDAIKVLSEHDISALPVVDADFDLVTSVNVSDDGHAAMLFIEARFIALVRSPLYFGLVPPW
jgi:CBS domain-containing protein